MFVSQKCQYALRAVFELAKRAGEGPVKIAEIAAAQAAPPRFLEVILGELKQGGFVASRRGKHGGYVLLRQPRELAVGEIVRFIEGPFSPVACMEGASKGDCELYGSCAFLPMWDKVRKAISGVYDNTTFRDLLDEEKAAAGRYVPSYSI